VSLRLSFICIAFLISINIVAQPFDELRKLPKDSLVKMAAKKFREPSFDVSDFSQVEVWAEDGELTVELGHVIRFIPKRGQYYYSVSVNLVAGNSSRQIMGNGDEDDIPFYKPKIFQDKIDFVFTSINKSNGDVGKIPKGGLPDGTMTITEKTTYYDIEVDSESTHSYYKIKKSNGEIYDAGHKHYSREDFDSKRERIY
jgi:hypothetical protein